MDDGAAAVPPRFERLARLLGGEAVERLGRRHVTVFGLGGVGSFATEGLARSGIGWLTLVDGDDVGLTNFNRQLHALEGAVGRPKVELMAERVRAINPAARVDPVKAFYGEATSASLLTPLPDLVLDCIDNVTAKLHLLATCMGRRIPIVTSLGAAAKLDPARVRAAPLAHTRMDPLGRVIRKNLRRRYELDPRDFREVTAIFSDEPVADAGADADEAEQAEADAGEAAANGGARQRVVLGSAVFVTSVFGMMAAAVAVRELRRPGAEGG
ncbi:MAG: tRNA threonylcarbamoyladenosine dehydratase [Lentisphaerae bacterium ADurb.BinA184]|nr:MAG: tRNA threonylcarbamoyladenosine dehydratase [Lentisphaerae bacterium ADurb.BinA184]